ncbi:MAG: hypothetical protein C4K47_06975 [Candidatus Thorarchaeota archaeon]|nr:MAG: hypothetical protein C4K47_06975 [Candidatus Thorarchaeota archaeon]
MSKVFGLLLTVLFASLGAATSYLLWHAAGWYVIVQIFITLAIGGLGEHYVSGQGYYHYTNVNGVFVGRVPTWIPFMWVFVVQGTLIAAILLGLKGFSAVTGSGILGLVLDSVFLEPYLSKTKGLWQWRHVESGYFHFVPPNLNKFYAPIGNYMVWLFFPIVMNWLLGGLLFILSYL